MLCDHIEGWVWSLSWFWSLFGFWVWTPDCSCFLASILSDACDSGVMWDLASPSPAPALVVCSPLPTEGSPCWAWQSDVDPSLLKASSEPGACLDVWLGLRASGAGVVVLEGGSAWLMVWTDSEEAPEDLRRRSSSEEGSGSSRTGEISDSVKTSSESEASVLRGAVLALSFPASFARCAASSRLLRVALLIWLGSGADAGNSRSLKEHRHTHTSLPHSCSDTNTSSHLKEMS